jgi:hypothetical protein
MQRGASTGPRKPTAKAKPRPGAKPAGKATAKPAAGRKSKSSSGAPRVRDQTPPPSRAKSTEGRAQYERNAYRDFAKAYMTGERTAGRIISYKDALKETSLMWNKKADYRRASTTSGFRKATDDDDDDGDDDSGDDDEDGGKHSHDGDDDDGG